MKRKFCLFLLITLSLFAITGCKSGDNDDLSVKSESYLAGGTIPAEAKVYPIVNEDLPMSVVDENNELTEDDIYTITHYVDIWATCDDTRGDGFQSEEAKEFTSMDRINTITEQLAESDRDYSIEGVQILAMEVEEDSRVQVAYIVKFTGQCLSEDIEEDTYESIEGLYFKKINGKWYEDGIGFLLMAKSGTIEYTQDSITGEYTIQPLEDYIS